MKNLTITLDDDLFAWTRVEAAKRGQSMSRFVSIALAERKAPEMAEQLATLEEFFTGPGWPGVSDDLPRRDEIHDRAALLRHESADLRGRPEGPDEAGNER